MSISSWILTICGICILSVIIDLILPDGQTSKHIKAVFSYIVILVVIAPIPSVFNKNFNIDDIFQADEIVIDNNYIYQLNQYKLDKLKNDIESDIIKKNILGVEIAISADVFNVDLEIKAIYVDLFNLVIDEKNQHINIEIVIVECIQNHIEIEKEKIFFNEWEK